MTKNAILSRVLAALLVVSAALLAWSLFIHLTGGVHYRLAGLRISSRAPLRPFLLGLACGAIAIWLGRRRGIDPLGFQSRGFGLLSRSGAYAAASAPYVAAAAAIAVLAIGLIQGSRAASGSDSFGYVSQAYLWLRGDLRVEQPFPAEMGGSSGQWAFTPLGYRPTVDNTAIVPTYAPGVPLLMAMLALVAGACGPYYLTPLCAAALVILTYRAGRLLSTPPAAALAALLVATSPTTLFMLMWPMSDIPVATFWMLSLVLAAGRSRPRPLLTGIAAGIAIIIRPNLAPLALVPALILLSRNAGGVRPAIATLTLFGTGVAPFVAAVAVINAWLYGSPAASGYGAMRDIYALSRVPANLSRYPRWFLESQGWLVLLSFFSLFGRGREGATLKPIHAGLFVAILLACYLPYEVFDDWWYLRFMLPAFPLVFILTADAIIRIFARTPRTVRVIACTACAVLAVNHGLTYASSYKVLELGAGERRYVDMGAYVRDRLPANAIVVAMQHSGSVRHYSGLPILRYDFMDGETLDGIIARAAARGRHAYAVLDAWEEEQLRGRATDRLKAALAAGPIALLRTSTRVLLYDLDAASRGGQPWDAVPRVPRHECIPPVDVRVEAPLR